jgi:hypothetical protein
MILCHWQRFPYGFGFFAIARTMLYLAACLGGNSPLSIMLSTSFFH